MTTIALENKKKIRGVVLSDDIIKELKDTGASHVMTFKDSKGKQYLAHLESRGGEVEVVSDRIYLEHRCPHCGGRVVVTRKGYFCEHCFDKQSPCTFHCNGILSHRFIKPFEVDAYLSGKPVILDGCYNSQGRIFSAVLVENEVYGMSLSSVVGKCPVCGEDVLVSPTRVQLQQPRADRRAVPLLAVAAYPRPRRHPAGVAGAAGVWHHIERSAALR